MVRDLEGCEETAEIYILIQMNIITAITKHINFTTAFI